MRKAIFTLLLFTFSASGAEMQDLPRDTRWAMHLDFRAMRGAKIVRQVAQNFFPRNSESLSSKIDAFQSILGLNLTNDLDELIYAGKGSSKSTIYLYLFGTFDVSRITAALNMQRTFTSEEYRTFSILGWQAANGVSYFLSFPRKDTAIFCRKKTGLKNASMSSPNKRKASASIPTSSPFSPAPATGYSPSAWRISRTSPGTWTFGIF